MTLTVKEVEELRNALSATFGANVAADLSGKFLNHLAGQSSPYMRATASEWGWDDTEVRDDVCGRTGPTSQPPRRKSDPPTPHG